MSAPIDEQRAPVEAPDGLDADLIASEEPFPDSPGIDHQGEPEWFKSAVFYEVLVRSFKDSNGDGTGDFRGLT